VQTIQFSRRVAFGGDRRLADRALTGLPPLRPPLPRRTRTSDPPAQRAQRRRTSTVDAAWTPNSAAAASKSNGQSGSAGIIDPSLACPPARRAFGARTVAASASAVVDFVLTQRHPVSHESCSSRRLSGPSRSDTDGDLGILRAFPSGAAISDQFVLRGRQSRAGSCSFGSMGREGFEPSTLGLRVDATALARSREGSQRRLLSEIRFGWVLTG
jgi:hypothetical protein